MSLPPLLPYQERVAVEAAELEERANRLAVFLNTEQFKSLPPPESNLLLEQVNQMYVLLNTLKQRLRFFRGVKVYLCHKRVEARLMTRGEYNKLRGWEMPANERPDDQGYLVEYIDGGESNHPDFQNHISWSPRDVFERGYKESTS